MWHMTLFFRRDRELNVIKITGCVAGGDVEAAGLMGVRDALSSVIFLT